MRNILVIFVCILFIGNICFAEENERFRGMYFSPVYRDLYERPVITWKNHDKIVDYHAGAVKLCESLGMRLPKKDEAKLLTDYLKFFHPEKSGGFRFWLYENAVGQIDIHTYISENSTSNAWVLYYYGVNNPTVSSLGAVTKTSGNASNVCAICVKEAPAMTFNERLKIFKNDYELAYKNGSDSFYGTVMNSLETVPWINYKLNKTYLEKVKSSLDEILSLEYDKENYQFAPIIVNPEDEPKLNENTIKMINVYNELATSDEI